MKATGYDCGTGRVAPFNLTDAERAQDTVAQSLGIGVEMTNQVGMRFRLVPPGEYLMGSHQPKLAVMTMHLNIGWLLLSLCCSVFLHSHNYNGPM